MYIDILLTIFLSSFFTSIGVEVEEPAKKMLK